MNIPKIEEAITLLYQTFIENQDVATQRGIAITAMNEMVKLLGGADVVKKIEAVPYSARLRAQHLFEDEPSLAKQEQGEPVALETVYETIIHWDEGGGKRSRRELARRIEALYTTPQQRKPMTNENPLLVFAKECVLGAYSETELADAAFRAIEAAHGIKE